MVRSAQEILDSLARLSKGAERAQFLQQKGVREAVASSGANVTLISGTYKEALSVKESLADIRLGLIARLNSRSGEPDGIGALGGLSERTSPLVFSSMTHQERLAAMRKKDDIIVKNNQPVLTHDINIIRLNNVQREMREELANLGINNFKLSLRKMELVAMPDIKDDNFITNIWNGQGEAWAITPYCHILQVEPKMLDELVARAASKEKHQAHSEAAKFIAIPLTEALKAYGNFSGAKKLEDGRNAQTDYRYPHEWLASWYIAAEKLAHDDTKIFALMHEIQAETPWKISFLPAARKIGKDLNYIASVLKIKPETMQQMEQILPPNYKNTKVSQRYR